MDIIFGLYFLIAIFALEYFYIIFPLTFLSGLLFGWILWKKKIDSVTKNNEEKEEVEILINRVQHRINKLEGLREEGKNKYGKSSMNVIQLTGRLMELRKLIDEMQNKQDYIVKSIKEK